MRDRFKRLLVLAVAVCLNVACLGEGALDRTAWAGERGAPREVREAKPRSEARPEGRRDNARSETRPDPRRPEARERARPEARERARTESRPDPRRSGRPEPRVETGRAGRPEVRGRPEAKPEVRGRPEAKPEVRGRPEAKPEARGRPEAKPEARGRPEAKPEARGRPEAKPEARGRPEAKPEARGRPEAKPEVRGRREAKPEARGRPEAKPEARGRPEAKPREREPSSKELRSREQDLQRRAEARGFGQFRTQREAIARSRNEPAARETLLRMERESGPDAHFRKYHGAQVTREQLFERARTGTKPDGRSGYATDSSAFLTEATQLRAAKEAEARYRKTGERDFPFTMAGPPIGYGYRAGEKNRGNVKYTNEVFVRFNKDGKIHTMFPDISGRKR